MLRLWVRVECVARCEEKWPVPASRPRATNACAALSNTAPAADSIKIGMSMAVTGSLAGAGKAAV